MKKYKNALFGLCAFAAVTFLGFPPSWWLFYEPEKPAKFMK